MWGLFATDIRLALEEHEQHRLCKSSTYLNCHFRVKWLYKTYVADVPPYKGQIPEYPEWFETFVMQWLNENDDVSLEFLHGAYDRDKKDGFRKNTEHSNFSSSVVDVFTQLTQCFEVLQKLECQNPAIWNRYMKRFAKTVVKVLTAYGDLLKRDFPRVVKDEKQACAMMNNIQQTRYCGKILSNMVLKEATIGNVNFGVVHPEISHKIILFLLIDPLFNAVCTIM